MESKKELKELETRAVLTRFIATENPELLEEIRNMQDSKFLARCKQYGEEERSDTNPVLVWTVGLLPDNANRPDKVQMWIHATGLSVERFFTSRINSKVEKDLEREDVRWNIAQFAKYYANSYNEFQSHEGGVGDADMTFIGVLRSKEGHKGRSN